jgi:hypothetical protein
MFRNLHFLPTFYVMGARETLQQCKPALLCKMDDTVLEHQSASMAKMLEVLDDFGSRHLSLDENTGLTVPWDRQQPLLHNVLAIPA